jgi:hypothetical protein
MGYCRRTAPPVQEPVSLTEAKSWLQLPDGYTREDSAILGLIQAAREEGEKLSGRALAQGPFRQVLDSAPYYTDTIQSQSAYPPSYYSLPRYSTTLWNYSQMIKLSYPPLISVQQMRQVKADGSIGIMNQDVDFILDRIAEPPRIFPIPGQYWPPNLYVANALEIDFTAGYDPDPQAVDAHVITGANPGQQPDSILLTGVPQLIRLGILNLLDYWFQNRGVSDVPEKFQMPFLSDAVVDFAPTRG